MKEQYTSPEWNLEDWSTAWRIQVGKVYRCAECGNTVMVVKGGMGTLDPRCHGKPMAAVGQRP